MQKTELKFNSQICTTKIQSKRLLELGLKPETADMSHEYIEAEFDWLIFPYDWNHCTMDEYLIPAWSLHRLLRLLSPREDVYLIMPSTAYKDIIDDIEDEIKCGSFNKEYLKQ